VKEGVPDGFAGWGRSGDALTSCRQDVGNQRASAVKEGVPDGFAGWGRSGDAPPES
jgi:hypothetical protein